MTDPTVITTPPIVTQHSGIPVTFTPAPLVNQITSHHTGDNPIISFFGFVRPVIFGFGIPIILVSVISIVVWQIIQFRESRNFGKKSGKRNVIKK